jgi:circadian clock protein KaiB
MAKLTKAKIGAVLRLYVAGNAPNSLMAIANLKTISDAHFPNHEVEIVDALKHPQRALADGIIVTPTLLKLAPPPVVRVIGNLSNIAQVLLTLANK